MSAHVLLLLAVAEGGVGRHVQELEIRLRDRGFRVTVGCPATTQQAFSFTSHVDVPYGLSPAAVVRAVRAVRGVRADLVHAHGLRAGALSGLAVRRPVITWHNAQLDRSLQGDLLERFVARRAAVTLAASDDLAERARALGAVDVEVVHVGSPVRAATGVDPGLGHPLVLCVGRLAPQKGYELLVAALAHLGDAVVAVAGEGPLRPALEAAAPQVHWLGSRDDVPDLLAAADVVVLPSRWEARSLTAQEAMLAGRPLVATAVGGLPGLVQDGAVLVPPDDARALGLAVRALLDDPARAARLGERARQVAATWPTAENSEAQLLEAYARAGLAR